MISYFVDIFFRILYLIIIIVVIISWIPNVNPRKEPIATFIKIYMALTAPIRAIIPPIGGMLDISPIILFLLLGFAHNAILRILFSFGL